MKNVSLTIHLGDRIGIVGLNGSGKSTLMKLLTEEVKSSQGSITRHSRLRMGYYSQHAVDEIRVLGIADPSLTALTMLSSKVGEEMSQGDMYGLLGSFGLPGRTASDVPVSKLSGGQLVAPPCRNQYTSSLPYHRSA